MINRNSKKKWKLPSVSKTVLFSMILLCAQIVFFSEYAMLKLGDMSALYALIGIPLAITPTIWAYYSKSKAENTVGGIVYDSAIQQLNNNNVSGSKG